MLRTDRHRSEMMERLGQQWRRTAASFELRASGKQPTVTAVGFVLANDFKSRTVILGITSSVDDYQGLFVGIFNTYGS